MTEQALWCDAESPLEAVSCKAKITHPQRPNTGLVPQCAVRVIDLSGEQVIEVSWC